MLTRPLVLLAALPLLLVSTDAAACHGSDGTVVSVACFTSLAAGASAAVYGTADAVYSLRGERVPRPWSWLQIFAGGAPVVAGGITTVVMAALDADADREALIVWGSGLTLVGGLLITRGIVQLKSPAIPAAAVVPLPRGGLLATVSWRLP